MGKSARHAWRAASAGATSLTTTCLDLRATDNAPSAARHALKAALADDVPTDVLGRVLLIASEMVTTALGRRSDGAEVLQLRLEADAGRVRLTVVDPRPPRETGGGRFTTPVHEGLTFVILDRLSDRWGIERSLDGATVWSEVDLH